MADLKLDKNIDFSPLYSLKDPNVTLSIPWWIIVGLFIIAYISNVLIGDARILFLPACFVAAIVARRNYDKELQRVERDNLVPMTRFAQANGLTFTPLLSGGIHDKLGGVFRQAGKSKVIKDHLSGELFGMPFAFYTYEYQTGDGKHTVRYHITVAEFVLPRPMPHMVIDSLVEAGNDQKSILPIRFDQKQRIELEGDFSKYFALYAPDKYGVDALTILAPDAMEAILQHAAHCDIEIINNKLYFYWPGYVKAKEKYEEAFKTVFEVMKQIGTKLVSGNISATNSQATLRSNLIQPSMMLKKQGYRRPLLGVFILTVLLAAIYLYTKNIYIIYIFGWFVVVSASSALMVWQLIKERRKRLLKQSLSQRDKV